MDGRCSESEVLTRKTQLVEVVLPCSGAVRDAVDERAEDGTATSLVDAEDVWAAGGGCG